MDSSKNKRFSFLGEEEFAALTAREKLAYLAAAITELQRCSGSTPRQSEGTIRKAVAARDSSSTGADELCM